VTRGLGFTPDDITRHAVATAFYRDLQIDNEVARRFHSRDEWADERIATAAATLPSTPHRSRPPVAAFPVSGCATGTCRPRCGRCSVACGSRSSANHPPDGLDHADDGGPDPAPGDDERLLAAAREAFGEIDILVLNGPGPEVGPDPGRRVQWDQCPAAQPRVVQPRACRAGRRPQGSRRRGRRGRRDGEPAAAALTLIGHGVWDLRHLRRHHDLVSPSPAEACVHVMPCAADRRWGRRGPGTTRSGAGGR
jgi:hypothetical protein